MMSYTKKIKIKKTWRWWYHSSAKWTLAFTVTFKRLLRGQPVNKAIMVSALRHFLRVLDVICLGKNKVLRGQYVPSAVVISWGTYGHHPHAHLSLAAPPGMTAQELKEAVEIAALKTQWFHSQRQIERYRDAGWSEYMTDHDPENLELSLLRPGPRP